MMIIDPDVRAGLQDQVRAMIAAGRWPNGPPPPGHMRGIDFYNTTDLAVAMVGGAQLFKNAHGYVPSLATPTILAERIYTRKYFAPLPMPSLADKLEGQAYVRARLGEAIIPSVVWVGEDVDRLFTADLSPGRYVLKASHGSGHQLVVQLPNELAAWRDQIRLLAGDWLATRFGYETGEWQYCTFKPRLFLERFIDYGRGDPPEEYKFYCFHGRAEFIVFRISKPPEFTNALYDTAWNLLPVHVEGESICRDRPKTLEAMLEAAERIAAGLPFARIDLYSDGIRDIKFSEITFTPGNARSRLSDPTFAARIGALTETGL